MAAQIMKASHLGWVDFSKKLVQLPPGEQAAGQTSLESPRKNQWANAEGKPVVMDGLWLAIAGLPIYVMSLAAVPALAHVGLDWNDGAACADRSRLVDANNPSRPADQIGRTQMPAGTKVKSESVEVPISDALAGGLNSPPRSHAIFAVSPDGLALLSANSMEMSVNKGDRLTKGEISATGSDNLTCGKLGDLGGRAGLFPI